MGTLKTLQLDWPTGSHIIAQGFGENFNPLYKGDGLKGHPAIDIDAPYNSPIRSASKGLGRIYKLFNKGNKDLMKYRAVCELIELDDCVIELTYGHCNNIYCPLGKPTLGEILATVGNTGDVFVGSVEVTAEEKNRGSTAGRHLHFQMRYCQKVTTANTAKNQYLLDENNSLWYDNGFYYLIPEYTNGYNGCIDPLPFLQRKIETPAETPLTADQAQNIQIQITSIKTLLDWIINKYFVRRG